MKVNPEAFVVWCGIAIVAYLAPLVGIVWKLHRIAKALEEANKLRSR